VWSLISITGENLTILCSSSKILPTILSPLPSGYNQPAIFHITQQPVGLGLVIVNPRPIAQRFAAKYSAMAKYSSPSGAGISSIGEPSFSRTTRSNPVRDDQQNRDTCTFLPSSIWHRTQFFYLIARQPSFHKTCLPSGHRCDQYQGYKQVDRMNFFRQENKASVLSDRMK